MVQKRWSLFIGSMVALMLFVCISLMLDKCSSTQAVDYVKFQDRCSLDWGSEDEEYLLKMSNYLGGDIDDRVYNILVTLNRCFEYRKSVESIVRETCKDIDDYKYSDDDVRALEIIVIDRVDNSYGSLEYRYGD